MKDVYNFEISVTYHAETQVFVHIYSRIIEWLYLQVETALLESATGSGRTHILEI